MHVAAADPVAPQPSGGAVHDYWLPWTFRRILALPGSPLAIGAGAALLLTALDLVWFNASGVWQGYHLDGIPIWLHPYGSVNFTYAITLGFSVVATIYLVRGAARDLSRLGPALELAPRPLADLRRQVLSVPARSLRVGTVVALAIAALDLWYGFTYVELGSLNAASQVWIAIREIVCDLLIFRAFTWSVIVALRLSRLARERLHVRLFDLTTLRPFSQNGIRLALIWLCLWAIWVPALFMGPFEGDGLLAASMMLGVGSALSIVAIAPPTLGPRRCLRDAKRAELARVREAIELDRSAALDPADPERNAAAARLPGLLAYEARVEGISESLLDARSLRRLGLYLLIPLASWVGGALIERLVDAALD